MLDFDLFPNTKINTTGKLQGFSQGNEHINFSEFISFGVSVLMDLEKKHLIFKNDESKIEI